MAAVLTQIQTTLTQLPQCAVSSPRQPLNSTAIFFDARLPLYSHVPSSQQTVILNGITTSACGLDIACVCRDDEFLTSLQSDLATSCDRHDQASKLLPHWASHCALAFLYSCTCSLERVSHIKRCASLPREIVVHHQVMNCRLRDLQ